MSETGNGRKNWTRVVAAVGLVFLAVAGGIVLANANKVINKTEKKDEETPLISIGFSQVGAESEWRTGNSISIKTTFSQKRGYDLIFKDAQQQQEQQIKAIRGFIQQDVNYIVLAPVATLILYTAGRGIAQLITDGQITYIRVGSYKVYGGYIGKCPVPTPIFIAIIVVVITYLVLKKTALGLYIESVGINGTASRLVGLNSTMIKFLTYVICGVLAGIAGIVASSRIYSADANNIGLNLEMDAILAVALGGNALGGGKFSLMGSVIGAYTIQALTTTLYAMNVSADQLPVYKAIVVIIIVTLQSPVFQKFMTSQKMKRANKAVEGGNN